MDSVNNDDVTTLVSFEADGTAVVRVEGEIDISTVGAVRTAMATAIERSPDRLVFDLAGVDFMDSSGIAVLLQARKAVRSIHIRNPSTVVRRLIELTGLADILPIERGAPS
jgi:anti-sigma B factor antagonist